MVDLHKDCVDQFAKLKGSYFTIAQEVQGKELLQMKIEDLQKTQVSIMD